MYHLPDVTEVARAVLEAQVSAIRELDGQLQVLSERREQLVRAILHDHGQLPDIAVLELRYTTPSPADAGASLRDPIIVE